MDRIIRWFKEKEEHRELACSLITILKYDFKIRKKKWNFKPIVRWYDMYIGIYIDNKDKIVYIFYLPCLGIKIYYG